MEWDDVLRASGGHIKTLAGQVLPFYSASVS